MFCNVDCCCDKQMQINKPSEAYIYISIYIIMNFHKGCLCNRDNEI